MHSGHRAATPSATVAPSHNFAVGDFPEELAICFVSNHRIGEFGRMNAKISRVGSVTISGLSVASDATFQIDFLTTRK
jgi:hypothetical protein